MSWARCKREVCLSCLRTDNFIQGGYIGSHLIDSFFVIRWPGLKLMSWAPCKREVCLSSLRTDNFIQVGYIVSHLINSFFVIRWSGSAAINIQSMYSYIPQGSMRFHGILSPFWNCWVTTFPLEIVIRSSNKQGVVLYESFGELRKCYLV